MYEFELSSSIRNLQDSIRSLKYIEEERLEQERKNNNLLLEILKELKMIKNKNN